MVACGPAAEKAASGLPTGTTDQVTATSSTTPPDATTVAPEPPLEQLTAPDPLAIAERALDAPLAGFDPGSGDPGLAQVLERRIGEMDVVIQALVWELLDSGDDQVVAASIYPHADFRGDPSVLPALADLVAGDGGEVTTATVDGSEVLAVTDDDIRWYLWGNHTHIMVTGGPEGPALQRIGQLAAHNAVEYIWQAGDCIAIAPDDGFGLPYSPHGEDVVVPCDRPHQYEVVAGDAARLGPGSAPDGPGDVYVEALAWCEEEFAEQIGAEEFDSSLEPVQFFPDPLEWERGDRYTACVVMQTEEAVPKLVDAAFAGRGDEVALARTVGDCHVWTIREPQVDCADAARLRVPGRGGGARRGMGRRPPRPPQDSARTCCARAASVTAEDGVRWVSSPPRPGRRRGRKETGGRLASRWPSRQGSRSASPVRSAATGSRPGCPGMGLPPDRDDGRDRGGEVTGRAAPCGQPSATSPARGPSRSDRRFLRTDRWLHSGSPTPATGSVVGVFPPLSATTVRSATASSGEVNRS